MVAATRSEITDYMLAVKARDLDKFERVPTKPEHWFKEDTIAVINSAKEAILTLTHVPGREFRLSMLSSRVRLTSDEIALMIGFLITEAETRFKEELGTMFFFSDDTLYLSEHGPESGAEIIAAIESMFLPSTYVAPASPITLNVDVVNADGKRFGVAVMNNVILHPPLPYTILDTIINGDPLTVKIGDITVDRDEVIVLAALTPWHKSPWPWAAAAGAGAAAAGYYAVTTGLV